jgi:hypothetical protein
MTGKKKKSSKATKVFGREFRTASGDGLHDVFIRGALRDDAIDAKSNKEILTTLSTRAPPVLKAWRFASYRRRIRVD